jgi:methylenetetrahydrofolate reductase (NADPH)
MPHLTCVGHTRAELAELLGTYRDGGVENVLALAGDPTDDGREGDFRYATELVELIRETGDFSVGVAAFPEGHPRSSDLAADRARLAEKLALADFGLTQFFFDVDRYRALVDDLDALGCDTPVIPGVMPFVSVAGTRRMAAMNGTIIPSAPTAWMPSPTIPTPPAHSVSRSPLNSSSDCLSSTCPVCICTP